MINASRKEMKIPNKAFLWTKLCFALFAPHINIDSSNIIP